MPRLRAVRLTLLHNSEHHTSPAGVWDCLFSRFRPCIREDIDDRAPMQSRSLSEFQSPSEPDTLRALIWPPQQWDAITYIKPSTGGREPSSDMEERSGLGCRRVEARRCPAADYSRFPRHSGLAAVTNAHRNALILVPILIEEAHLAAARIVLPKARLSNLMSNNWAASGPSAARPQRPRLPQGQAGPISALVARPAWGPGPNSRQHSTAPRRQPSPASPPLVVPEELQSPRQGRLRPTLCSSHCRAPPLAAVF